MEFFELVKFSESNTITSMAIIPVISKKVIISILYLFPIFFNNTNILNITGLYLPDRIKLKGKENY